LRRTRRDEGAILVDRWDTTPLSARVSLSSRLLVDGTDELRIGKPKEEKKQGEGDVIQAPTALKPFIFLDVSILREYLAVELSAPIHGFPFELERAIDDWVFLIFFVGNDFLPHLPSLEIREGAVDVLIGIWKASLDKMGGYLTEHGKVNLGRAQLILEGLAMREDEIFRKRREGQSPLCHPTERRSTDETGFRSGRTTGQD
jgi:5'-3' exoribonuclease 2